MSLFLHKPLSTGSSAPRRSLTNTHKTVSDIWNDLLGRIKNPVQYRVTNEGMPEHGIHYGMHLICDSDRKPKRGNFVIIRYGDSVILDRYEGLRLVDDLEGVVEAVVRSVIWDLE